MALIIFDYVKVNFLSWYAVKCLYISCFPSSVALSYYYYYYYYYPFPGLLLFSNFFFFTTDVCYTSGSLLLLYIPPSALFPVVPLCPILSPTAPNKARKQSLLSVQKYKPFSMLRCMTPVSFHLQSKAFRVLSNFQGHKLTYIPLLYSREIVVK